METKATKEQIEALAEKWGAKIREEKLACSHDKIEAGDLLAKSNFYGRRVTGQNNFIAKFDGEVTVKRPVDIKEVRTSKIIYA